MLSSKLQKFQRGLFLRSIYNWGNYDVSDGQCLPIRQECMQRKDGVRLKPIRHEAFEAPSFTNDKYPLHLMEIYERTEKPDLECLLAMIRHDKRQYKPSNKSRRYQRTWPECPLIWLRPRDTCCPDPERIPPTKRRVRPPRRPSLTAIEKHNFQMELLCKNYMQPENCKLGRRPPDCHRIREVTDCTKTPAPCPSFSEVCRHLVPNYCPLECACLTLPNRCDGLAKHIREKVVNKICTPTLIGYKPRLRFPF